jgi:AraC-like DNA-binding protein
MQEKAYLYKRIVQAKALIDSSFMMGLTVDKIASEACFSKFHFLRLFRGAYHMTPHQYLIALRIRKAKELLASNYSVTETCTKVGFASTSSFIHLFNALEKCTPSAYAARIIALQQDQAMHPLNHVPQCFADYMHWK